MNSPRRRAREAALKALYQYDLVDNGCEKAIGNVLADTVYLPIIQAVASEFLKKTSVKQILSGEVENFIPDFSRRLSESPLAKVKEIPILVKDILEKHFPGATYAESAKSEVDDLIKTVDKKISKLRPIENFAKELVITTHENLKIIDDTIEKFAKNWSLDRMASIDRCILRLATCEIKYHPSIPNRASINEAVEIAKKYSAERSYEFVNGILDKISKEDKKNKEELDRTAV